MPRRHSIVRALETASCEPSGLDIYSLPVACSGPRDQESGAPPPTEMDMIRNFELVVVDGFAKTIALPFGAQRRLKKDFRGPKRISRWRVPSLDTTVSPASFLSLLLIQNSRSSGLSWIR